MGRIFFRLYGLLVFSLVVFVVLIISLDTLLHPTIEKYYYNLARGTVQLTENRLRQKTRDEWPAIITDINRAGGYPLRLEALKNYDLTADTIQRLTQQGYALQKADNAGYLYIKFKDIEPILEIPFQQSEIEHEQRLARSTFEIIEQQLIQQPENTWPAVIQNLNNTFYFPIALLAMNDLSLAPPQMKLLEQNQVVYQQLNYNSEFDYHRIPDTRQVIRLGPFYTPVTLNYLQGLLLVFLAVVLATSALIWAWPLSRDLKNLDKTAQTFGQGRFDIRAAIGKNSAVSTLAGTFNTMADRIQTLISSHKELTNAVSHELRTPISRLRFAIDMLQSAQASTDRERFIQAMQVDIDELDKLVAELLTYARFDRDKPELVLQQQNIEPWLQGVVQLACTGLEIITIDYKVESNSDNYARFEPRLLARALSNLLHNACRYAHHRIQVTFTQSYNGQAHNGQVHDGQVHDGYYLYVDDDGPGIPADKREQIFEAFSRLDSSRGRDTGGYGLGLAIVSRIMQWHHGKASVEQSPLGGARFVLHWPL